MIRIAATAFAFVMAATAITQAQDYPSRTIKVLQGFPPGGNLDLIARVLANELQESMGQPVVVEAKPGASGTLAADTTVRSEADGYTLLVVSSVHPMYGALGKNVRYKVVDDFSWISVVSSYPLLICVRNDSRFTTLKQLIDEAHSQPDLVKYGSAGFGTGLHVLVELIANRTKSKFAHIPYRGESAAITALLTGDVDFVATTPGPIAQRIKAGEFRALSVTSKTRWQDLPDVPTIEEAGVSNFEFSGWVGLAGPPHLPEAIVGRLNAEVRKAVTNPRVKIKLQAMVGDPIATTPPEMKALVARQYETWKKLATDASSRSISEGMTALRMSAH